MVKKKPFFSQFCTDLSKKQNYFKIVYIYAAERSHYTLSENDIAHRGLGHL